MSESMVPVRPQHQQRAKHRVGTNPLCENVSFVLDSRIALQFYREHRGCS